MPSERIDTLIIGAGQAGLAMSEQLSRRRLPHLILERHRIAERWRSERWDGLHANGPAWHDKLPGPPIAGVEPDGFATRDQMVEHIASFAEHIRAPVRGGVEVTSLRQAGDDHFVAQTSDGAITAKNVVVATGPFQRPVVPSVVPPETGIAQLHSSAYRNPAQLPDGAALVVGSGSSGAQIADELLRAGRRVYLSVGRHQRPPRRYRGKDFCYWLGVLGLWDAPAQAHATPHVTIAVSGAYGGQTIDFRRLAARGITLLGRIDGYQGGVVRIAPDLVGNLARGDASHRALLDAADDYAARENLGLPADPAERAAAPDPPCVIDPVRHLDLRDAGITSIVWATGYALDFGWIDLPVFDERGAPLHSRGVTGVPGLYFLGLSWLSRRASAFVFGVERDAANLAEHIMARA